MEPGRILVVDDEPTICDGCRLVLSEQGLAVDACHNGRDGRQAILTGVYDLVLLDLKLPDIDGMDILEAARQDRPDTYLIVMTGYSTVQNAVQAMKLGAFDYLSKPFSDDELILVVQGALEKKRLVEENRRLRSQLLDRFGFDNIVGENPRILEIFDRVKKVAVTDSTVLITGESGTGKELFARAIHAHSRRATRNFMAVDCVTLSPGLLESELFGHVRGAFTGAIAHKAGIFEVADGGTLFLDDVANLGLDIQAKLLRVLEEGEYKPVGSSHLKKTDIRFIAATNKDLKLLVEEGDFRQDLFYRLNVVPIWLPPLRERRDDIPRLVYHFLRYFCRKTGKKIDGFTDEALEALIKYEWPGNARQLKNVIERLVIMSDGQTLDMLDLSDNLHSRQLAGVDTVPDTVDELKSIKRHLLEVTFGNVQKAFLVKALKACGGNITRAAERVGMKRSNFSAMMKKHDINLQALMNRN